MDPVTLLTACVLGIAYGIVGIVTKKPAGEPISLRKLLRTALLWGVASVIVAESGGTISRATVGAELQSTAVLGIIFDMVWSALEEKGVIPRWTKHLDIPDTGSSGSSSNRRG